MRLTVLHRVSPAGNRKPRPPWFSKRVALASLLRACDRSGLGGRLELVHVADGGVPTELADLVAARGDLVAVRGGDAPGSFRRALDVALARVGPDRDRLVWFAEDDHLYAADALVGLLQAAEGLPTADLFSLYTPDNAAWHAAHASQPGRRRPRERMDVEGLGWQRTWDSVSTFGLRADVLHADAGLLRLCSRAGGPWDHTTVCVLQGVAPYPWRHLYTDLYLRRSRASAGRVLTRPLVRAACNLAALRRDRLWVAPVQSLATHAEVGHLAPGTDWGALARSLT